MMDLGDVDSDLARHHQHYPSGGEITLQVLKGHLLVEEILREILHLQLAHPDALLERGARLSFQQVASLVEAITPVSREEPWLWTAIKRINGIRNDLAHQLSPAALDDKLGSLFRYVRHENPVIKEIADRLGVPEGHDFELVVICVCAGLSSLKRAVITEKPESEP